MKTYIVQLETHDDVISARDKISWSKAPRVLLVWPRKGKLLERRLDLLILYRHARQLGVQLALVTRDEAIRGHARELGIPTFEKAAEAQRSTTWRRARSKTRLNPVRQEREAKDPRDLRAAREEFRFRSPEKRWLRLAAFLLGVLSFLGLTLFFAPGARIELSPARQTQELDIGVWAGPAILAPNLSGGLPARVMTVVVEGHDQTPSTGSTYIPSLTASGKVQLTNLTDQPVEVPVGSVVVTTGISPVRFLTGRTVRVPAGPGESVEIPVRAVLPGRRGNVSAGEVLAMEGALGLRLAVETSESISGGIDRPSPAPTWSDEQLLRQNLLEGLRKTALDELRGQLKADQRLLDGTLQLRAVIEESTLPPVGEPGDQLQLSMRVEFEAWYIEERDLSAVAGAALNANRFPGFRPVADSLKVEFLEEPTRDLAEVGGALPSQPDTTQPVNSSASETVRWQVHIERELEAEIPVESTVRAILGRDAAEAGQILQERLNLDQAPRIELYPTWWPRLPFLMFRVELLPS